MFENDAVTPLLDVLPAVSTQPSAPTRADAEAAIQTLIRWAGDDPERNGLADTPARVVRAYGEWFAGYRDEPASILACTFDELHGYDDLVVLRNIALESTCEHHMAPIRGVAHVAYLPADRVVGLSKLARVVGAYARRLQVQERLTAQIANAIAEHLAPRGVAVMIEARHECLSSRGVRVHGAEMATRCFLGECGTHRWREEVLHAFGSGPGRG